MSKWNEMNEVTESVEFTDDMDIPVSVEPRSSVDVNKEFALAYLALEEARVVKARAEQDYREAKARFQSAVLEIRS